MVADGGALVQGREGQRQRHHQQARAHHVGQDQRLGQIGQVLHIAREPLRQRDAQKQTGAPLHPGRGVEHPQCDQQTHEQTDEQQHRVGVQPA
ncbi:MAG: hypothetical protein M3386_00235, partial [Actinomycetota bacterium]|nr:hypothetical protein [Actinomycetota bacterium]